MRWPGFLLLPLLFVACTDQQPAAPDIEVNAPSFKVTHDAWAETWDLTGEVYDRPACGNYPGEQATNVGTLDAYFRVVTTPSGNEAWHWKVNYYTDTPLSSTGNVSGHRWDLLRAEDTGGAISKAQGTQYVEHWQGNEWYVNPEGETFHLRLKYGITIDAGGNVQVERSDFRCVP